MNNFLKKYRIVVGIYLIWVFLNLIFLFMIGYPSEFSLVAPKFFFPFQSIKFYDTSEFIFYITNPIIIFLVYLCFKKEKRDEEK